MQTASNVCLKRICPLDNNSAFRALEVIDYNWVLYKSTYSVSGWCSKRRLNLGSTCLGSFYVVFLCFFIRHCVSSVLNIYLITRELIRWRLAGYLKLGTRQLVLFQKQRANHYIVRNQKDPTFELDNRWPKVGRSCCSTVEACVTYLYSVGFISTSPWSGWLVK